MLIPTFCKLLVKKNEKKNWQKFGLKLKLGQNEYFQFAKKCQQNRKARRKNTQKNGKKSHLQSPKRGRNVFIWVPQKPVRPLNTPSGDSHTLHVLNPQRCLSSSMENATPGKTNRSAGPTSSGRRRRPSSHRASSTIVRRAALKTRNDTSSRQR